MTVFYTYCGLHLCCALWVFIRNRKDLKKVELYREIANRYSWLILVIPILLALLVVLLLLIFTEYPVSTLMVFVMTLPLLTTHWTMDPITIRAATEPSDMRNPKYRTVISKCVKSRIITFYIIANAILLEYLFLHGLCR